MSLLLFTLTLFRPTLAQFKHDQTDQPEVSVKFIQKIVWNIRIISMFLIAIILTKLLFIIIFPKGSMPFSGNHFYSLLEIFFMIQVILTIVYLVFPFSLNLNLRLKKEKRFFFIKKVSNWLMPVVFLDILVTFIFYLILTDHSLFPLVGKTSRVIFNPNTTSPVLVSSLGLFLLTLILFILFSIFYLRFQRSLKRISGFIYYGLAILLWALTLTSSGLNLSFFSNLHLSANSLNFFSSDSGYIGFLWLFVLIIGTVSFFMSFIIFKLRKAFIAEYLRIHHLIQLNRLTLISLSILLLFNGWPFLMIYYFK